jgi:pimeloyl-ACP methyl ester carboxylesterase
VHLHRKTKTIGNDGHSEKEAREVIPQLYIDLLLVFSISMVSFWSSSAVLLTNNARLEQLKLAETKLLHFAKRYAVGDYDIRAYDTTIPRSCLSSLKTCKEEGDELIIHAIHVQNNESSAPRKQKSEYPLVALHGYYNGAAYYYRNLLGLASYFGNVYSLDALGWGLSSRPKYGNLRNNRSVESAEEWFVESLEAWRRENHVEKMILLGHSFGGYMSVAYAERYPERVERLLLLSPVGVPDESDPSFQERKKRLLSSFRSRLFVGVFQALFDLTTVGSFLRNYVSEQRAYEMVSNYVRGRLPSIEARDEQSAVTDYLYNNALAAGSGENAIHAILTNNILARQPLVHRIPKLKVENIRYALLVRF